MVTTGSLWLSGVSSGSQFNATKVNGFPPIQSSMCQVEFNLSEQNIVQCEISPFSPKRKGAQLLTTHFSMKIIIFLDQKLPLTAWKKRDAIFATKVLDHRVSVIFLCEMK